MCKPPRRVSGARKGWGDEGSSGSVCSAIRSNLLGRSGVAARLSAKRVGIARRGKNETGGRAEGIFARDKLRGPADGGAVGHLGHACARTDAGPKASAETSTRKACTGTTCRSFSRSLSCAATIVRSRAGFSQQPATDRCPCDFAPHNFIQHHPQQHAGSWGGAESRAVRAAKR